MEGLYKILLVTMWFIYLKSTVGFVFCCLIKTKIFWFCIFYSLVPEIIGKIDNVLYIFAPLDRLDIERDIHQIFGLLQHKLQD